MKKKFPILISFGFLWPSLMQGKGNLKKVQISFALSLEKDGQTETFFENAHEPLIPASLSKLLVADRVLEVWNEEQRFHSRFDLFGSVEKGSVIGSVGFRGNWDPSLTKDHLWRLPFWLKQKGINRIEGDLFIAEDQSPLQRSFERSMRVATDASQGTAFASSAIDFGTIEIRMVPKEKGKTHFDSFLPLPFHLKKLTPQSCQKFKHASYYFGSHLKTSDPEPVLETCRHNTRLSETFFYRPVAHPSYYTGLVIQGLLQSHNIAIKGKVRVIREEKWPQAKESLTLSGDTVGEMIWNLFRYSNNYLADGLAMKLWKEKTGTPPSSLEQASEDLISFPSSQLVFQSASGLDHQNRLSAAFLFQLLKKWEKKNQIYPLILNALPAPQLKRGTLKERKNLEQFFQKHNFLRAKTGTLSSPLSVVGLAGYLNWEGEKGVFVLIGNSEHLSLQSLRKNLDLWLIEKLNELIEKKKKLKKKGIAT